MNSKIIKLAGYIESAIGLSTFISITTLTLLSISTKPFNVFIFVIISSIISTIIGIGILNYKRWARDLLIFFSGYVILTKVLVYSCIVVFSGEILTQIPAHIKNAISILYHSFIIYFFSQRHIRKKFVRQK